MTQAHLIRDLDEYVIWFSFLISVLFPAATSAVWPWWKHAWGVNIIVLEGAIALALLPPWLRIVFGLRSFTYLFAWVQLASVTLVGLIIVWRLVLIWRTQRDGALNGRRLREGGRMTWTLGEDALLTLVGSVALIGALCGVVLGFAWGCLAARPRPARRMVLRNPLRLAARLYAWIWRETLRLCASRADVAACAEARVNSDVRC